MSDTAFDQNALSASTQIIDLFGGVRPLAKKLDMAASTVQGWKLRNHIPQHYHDKLRDLASEAEKSALDALLQDTLAEQTSSVAPVADPAPSSASFSTHGHNTQSDFKPSFKTAPHDPNEAYFAMPQTQTRYWIMTSLASIGILALLVVVLIFLFFGGDIINFAKPASSARSTLEKGASLTPPFSNQEPIPQTQSETTVPQDLVRHSRDVIDSTLDDVRKIKNVTPATQTNLVTQIYEIEGMITNLRDRLDTLDKQLQDKNLDTQTLKTQMGDISRRDVAAAALLLGVAQLSSILDRQNRFQEDLHFLKALVSHDAEMVKSIDKLAPFAEKGLMTKTQMFDTLNLLKEQTIETGKQHPDTSWLERIKMALTNVIHIRKNELAQNQIVTTTTQDGHATTVPQTAHGQILMAIDLIKQDDFNRAAQILKDYHGPHADLVMNIAHNMQGREAASSLMHIFMQKSQGLLDPAQLKSILSAEQPLSGTVY